jgi:hypothetical protein
MVIRVRAPAVEAGVLIAESTNCGHCLYKLVIYMHQQQAGKMLLAVGAVARVTADAAAADEEPPATVDDLVHRLYPIVLRQQRTAPRGPAARSGGNTRPRSRELARWSDACRPAGRWATTAHARWPRDVGGGGGGVRSGNGTKKKIRSSVRAGAITRTS